MTGPRPEAAPEPAPTIRATTVRYHDAPKCRCGARWTGDTTAHCATCHLTFGSVRGFDDHRVGDVDARRCRTGDELRQLGYEPNDRGTWRKPRPAGTLPRDGVR